MPLSACVFMLSLARQRLRGPCLFEILPDFSCSKAPPRTGSVPWLRFRRRSRTLPDRAAIYCRGLAGGLRCDGAVPRGLTAATSQKSLPYRAAPPYSLPVRVGLVLTNTGGGCSSTMYDRAAAAALSPD